MWHPDNREDTKDRPASMDLTPELLPTESDPSCSSGRTTGPVRAALSLRVP